jgi:multimeric flavodoxin WrbA
LKPKVLIVLGSPRKEGNSATLAGQVREGAQAKGAVVETVYLNGLNIKPCQGCLNCQKDGSTGCAINDDMNQLYPLLREANSIVIATPIYWFNMSAQTKIFIDRVYAVGFGRENIFAGKNFGIVLSFADPDVFHSGGVNALRSFQDMCRYLDATIKGMVYGRAVNAGEMKENKEVMEEAYLLGKCLAD